jgi:tryptophanyl-tRNA synthetase
MSSALNSPTPVARPRIFSGMQPTSDSLHLGNYLGALTHWVALQETHDALYCVVDLHALTVAPDPAVLRHRTRSTAAQYLAAGVDPVRSILFVQSHVAEHAELAWLLSCQTGFGEAGRMTQFKDKSAKQGSEGTSVGLFTYPVLMAADILLFDTNVVPVGKDQKQHLEMTRDIAIKFNLAYGETFVVPEERISESVATIPGLDGQKMSKSYGNTIEIFGDEKALRKKIMGIVMDSRTPAEPKPDADKNLAIQLLKLFAPKEVAADFEHRLRAGGLGYGDLKKALFEHYWNFFAPYRAKRAELAANPDYVDQVLRDGAVRARVVAGKTMARARKACGLR